MNQNLLKISASFSDPFTFLFDNLYIGFYDFDLENRSREANVEGSGLVG